MQPVFIIFLMFWQLLLPSGGQSFWRRQQRLPKRQQKQWMKVVFSELISLINYRFSLFLCWLHVILYRWWFTPN